MYKILWTVLIKLYLSKKCCLPSLWKYIKGLVSIKLERLLVTKVKLGLHLLYRIFNWLTHSTYFFYSVVNIILNQCNVVLCLNQICSVFYSVVDQLMFIMSIIKDSIYVMLNFYNVTLEKCVASGKNDF